jgi:hypothetical protein
MPWRRGQLLSRPHRRPRIDYLPSSRHSYGQCTADTRSQAGPKGPGVTAASPGEGTPLDRPDLVKGPHRRPRACGTMAGVENPPHPGGPTRGSRGRRAQLQIPASLQTSVSSTAPSWTRSTPGSARTTT